MLFNSPVFIFLFLPIVLLGYYLLNRRRWILAGKAWLVLASLTFYGYWNPAYLALIVTSMLFNFGVGAALHRSKQRAQGPEDGQRQRKSMLLVGVVVNLGLLAYFKYADFFIENVNAVLGSHISLFELALPLAISFFTFQQVAYLVDSYQYDTEEYDFLNYCLFVTFFPQLIAGPIVHHSQMMPQFKRLRNALPNGYNIALGLFVFSLGLFKKVYIADTFAVWANAGFADPLNLGLWQAWGTCLSYTFQLYYDFSGYSDMAIGGALLFNIRLPVNFNSPYKAVSIQDFWRRWHMTLSGWLKDYLYVPLGGNRKGSARTYVNLFITFLLGGLWHGAGWTFVIWGAIHGTGLAIHRLWNSKGGRLPDLLGWFITFVFACIAWVFFRAESLGDALGVLRGMFGSRGEGLQNPEALQPVPTEAIGYIVLFGLVAFLMPNSVQMAGFVPFKGRWRFEVSPRFALLTSAAAAIGLTYMLMTEASEFLYFNF